MGFLHKNDQFTVHFKVKTQRFRTTKDGQAIYSILRYCIVFSCKILDRLLCPDIVQFHYACLRSKIFLREIALLSTLNSNLKSSHSVDPQFPHTLLFYVH